MLFVLVGGLSRQKPGTSHESGVRTSPSGSPSTPADLSRQVEFEAADHRVAGELVASAFEARLLVVRAQRRVGGDAVQPQ